MEKFRSIICILVCSVLLIGCGPGETDATVQNFQNLDLNQAELANANGALGGPTTEDVTPGTGDLTSFGVNNALAVGFFGRVTSAEDGSPIPGATVTLLDISQNQIGVVTTGADGAFSFGTQPAGEYIVRAEAGNFVLSERTINFQGGDNGIGLALTPPLAPGQVRIILSWGESPQDLDAHLFLPQANPFEVFFSNQGSATSFPFAELDTDDTTGFGPETITITQLQPGIYDYAVFNFSGEGSFGASNGFVEIFNSAGRVDGFPAPVGGTELWWHVATINGDTEQVTAVNVLQDNPPR